MVHKEKGNLILLSNLAFPISGKGEVLLLRQIHPEHPYNQSLPTTISEATNYLEKEKLIKPMLQTRKALPKYLKRQGERYKAVWRGAVLPSEVGGLAFALLPIPAASLVGIYLSTQNAHKVII